jgi:antitoxin component YwqK of YwqJK toxin-antitoxin module
MERCDGLVVDYYPNGHKRIEGNFKNGYAVGKLTYYYSSGREREIRFYDRQGKGKIKKKLLFDESGEELK